VKCEGAGWTGATGSTLVFVVAEVGGGAEVESDPAAGEAEPAPIGPVAAAIAASTKNVAFRCRCMSPPRGQVFACVQDEHAAYLLWGR
jgi:hypothetical protein